MPAPYSTLQNIYTKVRRLTRSPSTDQLSDNDLNDYINNFVLYDLPEHLRLFNLRKTIQFYTAPNVDNMSTVALPVTNPLYNFKNRYITIHEPVYIAGFRRYFTQSREQFYGIYPKVDSIVQISTGTGGAFVFTGTLAGIPMLQNEVYFNSADANNDPLVLHDVPINSVTGNLCVPDDNATTYGTINYLTGAYSFSFPVPAAAGATVNSQTLPYSAAVPQAVLYYDDTFWFRPVPDQVYKVEFEVYVRPTEMLSTDTTQHPDLDQWWQYIAYGAAIKVFQDRMDMDSIQMIMPEFKNQQNLVNRTTIVQLTNQRTSTIFTEGSGNYPYGGWGFFGTQY